MENQIINANGVIDSFPTVSNLDLARIVLVENIGKTGDIIKHYANEMERSFDTDTTKWYELKGKARAGVKAERALFKDAMAEKNSIDNVDKIWQRIKEASGYVTAGNKAEGSTSIDAKTFAELKTMLNRIHAENSDSEGCELSRKALENIELAFIAMGGDLATDLTK
jgi:hypothetical protein